MSEATISAAIKVAIEAVVGIAAGAGQVQDHEPEVITDDTYVDLFVNSAETAINGWTIEQVDVRTTQQDPGFRFQRIRNFIVRGRFGLQEATGTKKAFQALIDLVEAALIGNVSVWVQHPEDEEQAIQTEFVGEEMHGPFLVHQCQMRFGVEEFVVIST